MSPVIVTVLTLNSCSQEYDN